MRENLTYGLMRGHQRRGDGRLERDTRLKSEKRCLLTSPGRNCAGVLLYKDNYPRSAYESRKSDFTTRICGDDVKSSGRSGAAESDTRFCGRDAAGNQAAAAGDGRDGSPRYGNGGKIGVAELSGDR